MLQWTAFKVTIKKLNYPFNVVILTVLLKRQLNQAQAKPKSQRNKEIKRRNAMTSWHRKQIRHMHKCAIRPRSSNSLVQTLYPTGSYAIW